MLALNFSHQRPQLVHGHGGETALVVRWYLRGKVVVSYCGDDLLGTPRADGSLTRSSLLRRFAASPPAPLYGRDDYEIERNGGRPSARCARRNAVIPNGVDRASVQALAAGPGSCPTRLGSQERVVLFAADPAVERKRFWLAEAACREAERTSVRSGLRSPGALRPRTCRG